jgi:hypothetical protein
MDYNQVLSYGLSTPRWYLAIMCSEDHMAQVAGAEQKGRKPSLYLALSGSDQYRIKPMENLKYLL